MSNAWSGTNIRYVTPDMLEETPSLCVIDVSFISLKLVLPVVSSLLTEDGHVANLIKPQFEAGQGQGRRKRALSVSRRFTSRCCSNYVENAHAAGFKVLNVTFSPIKGPEGQHRIFGVSGEAGRGTAYPIWRRSSARRMRSWTAKGIMKSIFIYPNLRKDSARDILQPVCAISCGVTVCGLCCRKQMRVVPPHGIGGRGLH